MTRRIKTRANQSLDRYLQEIGEVPLLTPDEEIDLGGAVDANPDLNEILERAE